ncbi:MAG: DUF58 domain-containing protein [Candidatus Brocadiae bacterium]|nr:DUF58 domain-containing protein [Candidatus Brocadiia bacterium]
MRPTPRFLLLLLLGLAPAAMAAWDRTWLLAAGVWDAGLVLVLLIERVTGIRPAGIEFDRTLPAKVCLGEGNPCAAVVRNYGWLPLHVRVVEGWPAEMAADPGELRGRVGPQNALTLPYTLRPGGRGEFTLSPATVWVRSPLGLLERRFAFGDASRVRVYPNLKDLRRFDLLSRRGLLSQRGIRAVRRVGQGREFEHLREYVPGDELRSVDWKATARRRRPVTRVHETERGQNVLILLDAGRLMAASAAGLTRLDHAINAALMLGYVALRAGDRVGLSVFSSDVESFAPPRAGRAALAQLMNLLVPLQPRLSFSNYRAVVEKVMSKMRRRALVVIYTDLGDPESAGEIVQVFPRLRRAHLPLCISFRDPILERAASAPPPVGGLFEHVAAVELATERRRALRSLRAAGVEVADVAAEEMAVESVNRYLSMKRRQAL